MRRTRLAPPLFALALLAVAGAAPASAAPVTLSLGGTLTDVDLRGYAPPAGLPVIAKGVAWSLAFTFDGETEDSTPGDPAVGLYASGMFITGYDLTIGESTVSYSLSGTSTILGAGQVSTMPSFGYIATTQDWSFSLQSLDAGALASDALPVAWPGLSVFDHDRTFAMNFGTRYGTNSYAVGAIEWLGAPTGQVPEPGALALVGGAGAALLRARRRG